MDFEEKPLKLLADRPMIERIIDRLRAQLNDIVINANGDPSRFVRFGLPVMADSVAGFAGPLAGILAGMEWARQNQPETTHIVTVAADTPFFPDNLVKSLQAAVAAKSATIAVASSGGRRHPVFGLWPIELQSDLCNWLGNPDNRRVTAWIERHDHIDVEFSVIETTGSDVDPFFNVNTPEDFERATQLAAGMTS